MSNKTELVAQLGSLSKKLVKQAGLFKDYNFRNYFQRIVEEDYCLPNFEEYSIEDLEEQYAKGIELLSVLERQTVISDMYNVNKHVLETKEEMEEI